MSRKEENGRKPAFMAWLPAKVRYDPELPASAKLLFAEISAMTDSTGYCWATNEYFCKVFGMSERTVRGLISNLVSRGYIVREVIRNEKNEVVERRLWLAEAFKRWAADPDLPPPDYAPTSGNNLPDPSGENLPDSSGKNLPVEHIKYSEEYNVLPPIVPQEGDGPKKAPKRVKKEPRWKPERFEKFWEAYPRSDSNENMKRSDAVKAWDKLRADDVLLDKMAELLRRQKATRQWQKGNGIPYASTWLNGIRMNGIEMPEQRTATPGTGSGMEDVKGAYRL